MRPSTIILVIGFIVIIYLIYNNNKKKQQADEAINVVSNYTSGSGITPRPVLTSVLPNLGLGSTTTTTGNTIVGNVNIGDEIYAKDSVTNGYKTSKGPLAVDNIAKTFKKGDSVGSFLARENGYIKTTYDSQSFTNPFGGYITLYFIESQVNS